MSVRKILNYWRTQPEIAANIVEWRIIPAREPDNYKLPIDLHPSLLKALQDFGISSLYSHQAQTWSQFNNGKNVVIVTGTASGKSLAYNIPVFDRLLKDNDARALYIHPTKALSQDQLSILVNIRRSVQNSFNSTKNIDSPQIPEIDIAIYDGDTPTHIRQKIRSKTRLLLTNPDMLHLGILPHHTSWVSFFSNLQLIVIDEVHTYRGVFGSHFANVIRRLKRIVEFYGSFTKFLLTSATISNPLDLAENLVEERFELIDNDGSGRGQQTFLIYNPPIVNKDLGLRRSSLQESVRLASDLFSYENQTIIFGRSRRTIELILKYLRRKITTDSEEITASQVDKTIRGYRSGYLPADRRRIEMGLRNCSIRTVVATNALELGIDIGMMNAAILVGYPGTIASTTQQAGRSGRGQEDSLAILITTPDPLDQFLATHPNYLFDRSPEHALIDPNNILILLDHLKCAAFEIPLKDESGFGNLNLNVLNRLLEVLIEQGVIHKSEEKYFWMAEKYPAENVSLRSASAENITLQTTIEEIPITIGFIDSNSAHWLVHPNAVYLHEASTYFVEELDLDKNIAFLKQIDTDYYTEPRRESDVDLVELILYTEIVGGQKFFGDILVTSKVIGFRKIKLNSHEQIGTGEVTLPPTEFMTQGYWFTLNDESINEIRESDLWRNDPINYGPKWKNIRVQVRQRDDYRCQVCGIRETDREHDIHHKIPFRTFSSHAQANRLNNLVTLCQSCHQRAETVVRVRSGLSGVSYVLRHLAPIFLMCDVRDLAVHSDVKSSLAGGKPSIVLYDQIPAGLGLSKHLYDIHDNLLKNALELISNCDCYDGCPSCVGPGGEEGSGGKEEAKAILGQLTNILN